MTKPLQVMKFGGTSVGDAVCIGKVVEIIRTAARAARVAVVVSAMSGVTNRLIEAAQLAKAGNESAVAEIFEGLRKQHDEVIRVLIGSVSEQQRLRSALQTILAEGERQCHGTALLRELTARTLDAVSGLGERLCAPLLAAALAEAGVASEAIDATELIVTDSYHGGAEPWIDLTRSRCQTRALTLLQEDIVPVVTGFIGATEDGVVTTLGRGGSDYSATILGAALNADEVVIWSDVSGLLTADPRLVAKTSTIPEISYREAAELAYFGAKVLHPKTLRPVMDRGIPVWIRNTFAPDDAGTKITSRPAPSPGGVKAMAAMRDAALITVAGQQAHVPTGFLASITVGLQGSDLSPMAALSDAGALGFTDDGKPVTSAGMLRKALQYQRLAGGVIALHEEDPALSGAGVMHEGAVSARLGVTGIPSISESTMVARDSAIAKYEDARMHFQHLSCIESVQALEYWRGHGARVSGEATPHHLTLTDEAVRSLDTRFKMNPPLRTECDRRAIVEGLRSGVIECIASDHAPHARFEKEMPFEQAPMGTTGLETSFAAVYSELVKPGVLPLGLMVERMTAGGALYGLPIPKLEVDAEANIVLIDLEASFKVGEHGYASRSENCCFHGRTFAGVVELTVAAGAVVYENGKELNR